MYLIQTNGAVWHAHTKREAEEFAIAYQSTALILAPALLPSHNRDWVVICTVAGGVVTDEVLKLRHIMIGLPSFTAAERMTPRAKDCMTLLGTPPKKS